jgi:hypothetical protein
VHHSDLDRGDADGVAVGLRFRDRGMADDAGAARAVHDVDRLADLLLQQGGDDACGGVGAAACAPGHDQGQRPFGIGGLRVTGETDRARHEGGCGGGDETASFHVVSSNADPAVGCR